MENATQRSARDDAKRDRSSRDLFAQRFAENLLTARRRVGLSQEALGYLAGLHRTEIGKLEYAERIARIDSIVKLATVLEISVDQLVDGLAWEPPERLGESGRFVSDGAAGEFSAGIPWRRSSSPAQTDRL
jgi:transcriptional regulator with XRE-family HTH domain